MLQVLPNGWPEGNRAAPYVHFIGQNVAQSAISVNGDISIYPDNPRKVFAAKSWSVTVAASRVRDSVQKWPIV